MGSYVMVGDVRVKALRYVAMAVTIPTSIKPRVTSTVTWLVSVSGEAK